MTRSFRLPVGLLPIQARGPGLGDETDPGFPVVHLPMLSGVVGAAPSDFEPAQFM